MNQQTVGGLQRNNKRETDANEIEINKGGSNELYAVYIGHQPNGVGGGFDLFNVVDETRLNVLDGSTVSVKTIIKLNIKKVLDKSGNPVKLGEDTKGDY